MISLRDEQFEIATGAFMSPKTTCGVFDDRSDDMSETTVVRSLALLSRCVSKTSIYVVCVESTNTWACMRMRSSWPVPAAMTTWYDGPPSLPTKPYRAMIDTPSCSPVDVPVFVG